VIGPSAIVFRILVLVVGRNGCIRSVLAHLWLLMKPPALSRRAEIPIDTRHPARYAFSWRLKDASWSAGRVESTFMFK
jgi:hypothetical protein